MCAVLKLNVCGDYEYYFFITLLMHCSAQTFLPLTIQRPRSRYICGASLPDFL